MIGISKNILRGKFRSVGISDFHSLRVGRGASKDSVLWHHPYRYHSSKITSRKYRQLIRHDRVKTNQYAIAGMRAPFAYLDFFLIRILIQVSSIPPLDPGGTEARDTLGIDPFRIFPPTLGAVVSNATRSLETKPRKDINLARRLFNLYIKSIMSIAGCVMSGCLALGNENVSVQR